MRIILQRVNSASVTVDGSEVSSIGRGLLLYLGFGKDSDPESLPRISDKIVNMRIFQDGAGKMNLSLIDVGGEILLVSQFTLYASTKKGNRPSFTEAMEPIQAEREFERFAGLLRERGIKVSNGVFGAHMNIQSENDGPVTIIYQQNHKAAE